MANDVDNDDDDDDPLLWHTKGQQINKRSCYSRSPLLIVLAMFKHNEIAVKSWKQAAAK